MDLTLISLALLLVVTVVFVAQFINKHISPPSKSSPLPPGPKPWPIVGNIPNLINIETKPHIFMAYLAKIHGPLISLRLGTQLLVVGSSLEAATKILKTNDHLLSGRYQPKMSLYDSNILDRIGIISATKCTQGWKNLRALCKNELFSAKAVESQASLREKKVGEMVDFLRTSEGKIVNIGEIVFTTVFNSLANLVFSKDLIGFEDTSELKRLVRELAELGGTPNIADLYPIFAWLDPQGLKRKFSDCVRGIFSIWGIYIKGRRDHRLVQDGPRSDFLDVLLANEFDDLQINWLVLELFSAGTDTTTATIEWAMAELLKNEKILNKVREEQIRVFSSLKVEINENRIQESHVCQLPYLNACIKETLRLHPPVPLLVPHRALKTCEVMNYTIPKDSQVFMNVWAIGRDTSIWEDPLSFKPDRFLLGSNLDFTGHNYEFLPFSSGRRICPGLPMATKQVHLILASLIHNFDWSLPNSEDPSNLDMNEKFGLSLQKEQPLLLVPKRIF